MFERFTTQSRRVIVLAQEEARLLNHHHIGSEHLLLGLLHEGRGAAAKALAAMDVTLDAAQDQVVTAVGRGQEPPSGHLPFTARARKSLELSQREATALEDFHIGTGHLLLGLIQQGDNTALGVLATLGADLADLRARVTRELVEHPEQGVRQGASPADLDRQRQLQIGLFLRETLPGVLDTIEERLTAIERQLGITPSADPDAPPGTEPDGPRDPPAAG
jgi:ATP-dependent Clp protease ATP-binding subunit ClpC